MLCPDQDSPLLASKCGRVGTSDITFRLKKADAWAESIAMPDTSHQMNCFRCRERVTACMVYNQTKPQTQIQITSFACKTACELTYSWLNTSRLKKRLRVDFLNAVYVRRSLTCSLRLTNDLIDGGQPRAKPRLRKVKPNHVLRTVFSFRLATVYQVAGNDPIVHVRPRGLK